MTKYREIFAQLCRSANRPRRKPRPILSGEECEARIVPTIWWLGTAGDNWNSDSWTNVSGGTAVPGLRPDGSENRAIAFDSGQAHFNPASTAVVNDIPGLSNLSLSIVGTPTASAFTLSGDALSLSSGLNVSSNGVGSPALEHIDLPLIVPQNQSWTVNAATEIGGAISGPVTATLTISGAQNILFLGNNTFAGPMQGTWFRFGNGGTSGAPGTAYFANSTIFINRSDTVTLASEISQPSSLVLNGTGTVISTGGIFGNVTISAGILQFGNGATPGFLNSPSNVSDPTTVAVDSVGASGIGGNISGPGNLVQFGSGAAIVTGNETYTGGTTISAGTLQIGNGSTTGSLLTGSSVVDDGTLMFSRSDTVTLAYNVSGTGGLGQNGPGTLVIPTGLAMCTGPSSVLAGTLTGVGLSGVVTIGTAGTLTGNGTYGGIIGGGISGNSVNTGVGSGGSIDPGTTTSAGILTAGSLVGSPAFPFRFEITGNAIAGIDFDQIKVPGPVTLDNPTLSLVESGLAVGDSIPLIVGATSVVGNFAGLPEGTTFAVGSDWFRITYAGGAGHDIVVTKVAAPTAIYVSASWAGDAPGTSVADPTLTGGDPAVIGTNAFATIGAAVAQAANLGGPQILVVNPGNYGGEDVVAAQADQFLLQGGNITIGSIVSNSTASISIPAGCTLTLGDTVDFTFAATFLGAGNLTKVGSDTMTAVSASVLAGSTTVSAGTLTIDADGSAPGHGSGGLGTTILTVNSPGVLNVNLLDTSAPVYFAAAAVFGGLAGTGIFNFNYLNSAGSLDSSFLDLNSGNLLAGSVINLNQSPGGSSRLRDAGVGYSGFPSTGGLGRAAINVTDSAELYLNGIESNATLVNSVSLSGNGYVEPDGTTDGALRFGNSSYEFPTPIKIDGDTQISGPGVTYSVPYTSTDSNLLTLGSASASALPEIIESLSPSLATNNVTIEPNATVRIRGKSSLASVPVNLLGAVQLWASGEVDDLTGTGTIYDFSSAGAGITVNSDSDTTFAGTFVDGVDALSVSKNGPGTLTLTNAGTDITGSVYIQSGGLRLTTAADISAGAVVSTADGFHPGGTLAFDLDGTQCGQMSVASASLTGLTLGLNVGDVLPGQSFTLLSLAGTSGGVVGTFANLSASGSSMRVGGQSFEINYAGGDGNDVVVTAIGNGLALVGNPVLNGGASYVNNTNASNQHSMIENVVFSFSQPVVLSASNFTLTGINGTTFAPTVNVSPIGDGSNWSVTFAGDGVNTATHSIGDGEYRLLFNGLGLSITYDFFRLLGDMDGDGTVGAADFSTLISTFLRSPSDPLFLGACDFDGDGTIGASDLSQFTANYLESVPTPLPN